jgi:hypothetical protein
VVVAGTRRYPVFNEATGLTLSLHHRLASGSVTRRSPSLPIATMMTISNLLLLLLAKRKFFLV